MTATFYDDLRELALTPSEFGYEKCIGQLLMEKLTPLVDQIETDPLGNMYALRQGKLPGTVGLVAHQDKVMKSTILAYPSCATPTSSLFTLVNGEYCKPEDVACAGGIIYALRFDEEHDHVRGKLDDTLGLSLIIDMLRTTSPENSHSILAVLTVGEEQGLHGATYAVKNNYIGQRYTPDVLFVLEASPAPLASGIILKKNCGVLPLERICMNPQVPKPGPLTSGKYIPFVDALTQLAKQHDLTMTPQDDLSTSDARVFARRTNIPTIMLSIPVQNMHDAMETSAKADIEQLRTLLRIYLTHESLT